MGKAHTVAERIQALALAEYGVPLPRVAEITGMSERQISRLKSTARKRGFDPRVSHVLKTEYVADAPRSGRPRKVRNDEVTKGTEIMSTSQVNLSRSDSQAPLRKEELFNFPNPSTLGALPSTMRWPDCRPTSS